MNFQKDNHNKLSIKNIPNKDQTMITNKGLLVNDQDSTSLNKNSAYHRFYSNQSKINVFNVSKMLLKMYYLAYNHSFYLIPCIEEILHIFEKSIFDVFLKYHVEYYLKALDWNFI